MKKYLLITLLGVFGLFGAFASADTVCTSDGFTAQNVNLSVSSDADSVELNGITYYEYSPSVYDYCGENGCYILINSTSPSIQYYGDGRTEGSYFSVSSFPVVYNASNVEDLSTFYLYSTSEVDSISGNFSFSTSPITCNSSSSGGGSSSSSSSQILSGGISQLSPVITSISSVMSEFIPYVVYIGIGILLVTLGFKAIKRLVNWLSSKITRYFK